MAIQKVGFFAMLQGIYAAINALSSAATHGANALNNLGEWAEESTASFVDEARDERALKNAERRKKFSAELASIGAVEDATPKSIAA